MSQSSGPPTLPGPDGEGLGLRRFARDSSYTMIRQVIAIVLGMAISILLARGLGVEDRGVYAVALLLPRTLVTFLNLGVAPATVYFVGRGDRELEAAARGNIALAFWNSLLAVLVGAMVIVWGGETLFPGVPVNLLLISLAVAPLLLHTTYLLAILQGIQDFRAYNWVTMIPQMVMLALVLVLVWWIPGGPLGALAAFLGGNLAALAALIALLMRRSQSKRMFALWLDWAYTRQVMGYGLRAHVSNIIAFLNYRADMFLLNLFTGAAAVGVYAVAVGLAERMWILSKSVSTVMLPRIASLDGEEAKRRQLTPLIARHVRWCSLAMGLVTWVLAKWGIVLLYSDAYLESAVALRALLPGVVALSFSKILANDIAGRGNPGINSQQSTIAFVVNVIANLILIPRLGVVGAALATSLSYSLLTILKLFVYIRIAQVSWRDVLLLNREDWRRLGMASRLVMAKVRR
jgi:O-antigen/teichoic acid export membrane protein